MYCEHSCKLLDNLLYVIKLGIKQVEELQRQSTNSVRTKIIV